MRLLTAEEEMQLAVRSMLPMNNVYRSALAVRDSIATDTLREFAQQTEELVGKLGVDLRKAFANNETYPLQASVRFRAIDAHKLVTHMDALRRFDAAFRTFYGLAPKNEEQLPIKFTFAGSVVPAVPRLMYATTLTIIVNYGPAVDTGWMSGEVTL